MSKNIQKFDNITTFNAANLSDDEPHVSLVGNQIVTKGVNVIVPFLRGMAMTGDHLYFDKATRSAVLIRQNGYKKSLVDASRYIDARAVFACNIGDKPLWVGVDSLGSKVFSQYSRCKLTGFDLENGGTAKIANATASYFSCEFTYEAGATYAEIVAAMTSAKTGTYASYVTFVALEDGVGVRCWPVVSVISGGLTLTWNKAIKADGTEVDAKVAWDTLANYCDLTEIGNQAMNMMGNSATGILHEKQYIEYIRTLGSQTTFGTEETAFMNQATFNSCSDGTVGGADGIALYNKYGGSYDAYAAVCASLRMIDYDAPYKTAETLRDGIVATRELAAVKMYEFDGTLLDAFPGPAAAHAYGIATDGYTTGFEAGNWHQLGVGELSRIMRIATSRTSSSIDSADVLNQAIIAAGGTVIVGNTTYQLCGAYYVKYQLVYSGSYGYLTHSNRIGGLQVRVALDFDYPNP